LNERPAGPLGAASGDSGGPRPSGKTEAFRQAVRVSDEERGYVSRRADPSDGRSRLLRLTDLGWACTRAAEDAAADTAGAWEQQLGADTMARVRTALQAVVVPGRLRPAW
jgi:hypothetical protein